MMSSAAATASRRSSVVSATGIVTGAVYILKRPDSLLEGLGNRDTVGHRLFCMLRPFGRGLDPADLGSGDDEPELGDCVRPPRQQVRRPRRARVRPLALQQATQALGGTG